MANIVIIHGINNETQGRHTLRQEFLAPLRDGIELAIGPGTPLPEEKDLEVVFWGDLFRTPAKTLSDGPPPLEPSDLREKFEQGLLRLWLQEAERSGAVTPPRSDALGTPHWVQTAIYKLVRSSFFRKLYGDGETAERWLIHDLKTVHRYMTDPRTYEAVQHRVDSAIATDTRVLIGHSLGSVVAYEGLCRHARGVNTLITLASPLGIPTFIYDMLRPHEDWRALEDGRRVRIRPAVASWYNVADAGDIVALVKALAPLFQPVLHDIQITTDPKNPHAIRAHLTDAAVGRAVYEALH